MSSVENIESFLKNLQRRLKKEMPKVRAEIKVYEQKLASGKLTKNPIPGPQFNG